MSKILMILENVDDQNLLISELRKITKKPVLALKNSFDEKTPFYEGILFLNDHEEISISIIKILKILNKLKADVTIFEVEDHVKFKDLSLNKNYKIDEVTLKNILNSWKQIKV